MGKGGGRGYQFVRISRADFHKGGCDVHMSCVNSRVLLWHEGRGGGTVQLKEMYSIWVTSIVLDKRRIVGKVSMKTREVIRSNSLENSGDSNILMATAINHSVIPLQSSSDCLACPGVLDSFMVDGWRGYTGVVRKPPWLYASALTLEGPSGSLVNLQQIKRRIRSVS